MTGRGGQGTQERAARRAAGGGRGRLAGNRHPARVGSRRAATSHRTGWAARCSGRADPGAKLHRGVGPGSRVEGVGRRRRGGHPVRQVLELASVRRIGREAADEPAADVGVHRADRLTERDGRDGTRRVGADPGQPLEVCDRLSASRAPAICRGRSMEIQGAAVVAEAAPTGQHLRRRRRGHRCGRRVSAQEGVEPIRDARGLRLLEHDLGHEDRPRIAAASEWQIAVIGLVPGQDSGPNRPQRGSRR